MKGIIFTILALGVLVQSDRGPSSFRPNQLNIIPKRLTLASRIVGGREARPHQYPHQVALFIGKSFCGGSVIDAHTILTAAHCVDTADSVEVVAGAHNISKSEDSQQRIISHDIVVHSGWDRIREINDVAVIRLPKPLKLNEYVKAIDLYGGDSALVGKKATVSGWGRYSDSVSRTSDVLRHVTSNIITNQRCGRFFDNIFNSLICINGKTGKSSCYGDSGGPLIYNNNGVLEQIGIVSFGKKLCASGFPSAYTRISYFKDWINRLRLH